jgi:hypothetical protein
MTLFDFTEFSVGALIVIGAVRPTFNKLLVALHKAREGVRDVLRRKHSLSQQIRALAKESLHQRINSVHDAVGAEDLHDVIAALTRNVEALEAVDRRVVVLDERRGQREVGWILLLARDPPGPQSEPPRITELWQQGRYLFFWAQDEQGARHRAGLRFPERQGFRILQVIRHEGDLSEPPGLSSATGAGKAARTGLEQVGP